MDVPPKSTEKKSETVDDFIGRAELSLESGITITLVEHPDAEEGKIHPGKFSGIPLAKGKKPRARLSSGTWIE